MVPRLARPYIGCAFFVGGIMRKFEKISYQQFEKDIGKDDFLYASYELPKRSTCYSAGYDFFSLIDDQLFPGETKTYPLGVKVQMETDDCLLLMIRSSQGFHYNLRLVNQVGVVDKDYYDNTFNEGHMMIRLRNEGEKVYSIRKGDKICQGIFVKYYVTDDDSATEERIGGFGSTNGRSE